MSATDLSLASIEGTLRTRRLGRSLVLREETESTNDDARAAADAGCPHGHVVVADHQRAGRGSSGRRWDSPPGVDLYFSIVARLELPPPRLPPLTLAVGLGVAEVLDPKLEQPARLKWPNDVLIGDRKCSGILVETSSVGARVASVIVGVGVGVNRARFEPPLDRTATSLRIATGEEHPRGPLLGELLTAIERALDRYVAVGPEPIAAEVDGRLAWRGERVRVDERHGILCGVAPSGALRLEVDGREVSIVSGTLQRGG